MRVRCKYFGFASLGEELLLEDVNIMQTKWNKYEGKVKTKGRKHIVSPKKRNVSYVIANGKIVFFVAVECGIGQYYIFTISNRAKKKLLKERLIDQEYNPNAVEISKVGSYFSIYDRVMNSTDVHYVVSSAFFKLIEVNNDEDHIQYVFTNDGVDRHYLNVYDPVDLEETEDKIIIPKAKMLIWLHQDREVYTTTRYEFADIYVKATYKKKDTERIYYFR